MFLSRMGTCKYGSRVKLYVEIWKEEIKDLKLYIKAEVYELLLFFEMLLWFYT